VGEKQNIEVSIVAPVYNEEENLPILVSQLVGVLTPLGKSYEMIFVDDGSTDRSRMLLRELAAKYPEIRVLGFKENCGESAALAAGLKEARGFVVITMDADLQNDPKDIPMMLDHLNEYDMVTGGARKGTTRG